MKYFFSLALCFLLSAVYGQNTTRFSQFNFTRSLYNPGSLATDARFQTDLVYRNQWAGVEGSPRTIGFNASYELMSDMAVGINFYNDQIGLNQTNAVQLSYAYRLLFDERNYLAFGLGLGMDNISTNFASATTISANDPAFAQSYSTFGFNGSFGLYYRTPSFYAGASIPQLFQNTLTKSEKGINPVRWHYMLISGYYWELSDNFVLNPNIQLKLVQFAPIQGDILLRGITGQFGFSAGYRSENSLIAGMDFTLINRLRIGYSFNYDLGSLARTKGMSHEVYLGLGLPYYFYSDNFDNRKYIGRKGGSKRNYKRSYARKNRKR